MVLWKTTRPFRTNTKKRCPSHHRQLECKSRKSRDTWSNKQVCPWNTKWSRAKAKGVLPEHTLVIANTFFQQHKRWLPKDITRWAMLKLDWSYSLQPKMEKLYTVSKNKTGSWLWPRSWTPYCKFKLKLKKVGKTTRPFRYDLNQIPDVYSVEVTSRFKGLNLVDGVSEEQEAVTKTSQRKRNVRRQRGCLRRAYKWLRKEEKRKAMEKGKDLPSSRE